MESNVIPYLEYPCKTFVLLFPGCGKQRLDLTCLVVIVCKCLIYVIEYHYSVGVL